jgi:hypothetical protein
MRGRLLRLVFVPALLVGMLGAGGPVAAADDDTDAAPGTLAAKVHGAVRIGGSMELNGVISSGGIRISGLERDCELRVQTWTSKTIYADGAIEFRGADGRFHVRCRTILVELRSTEMRWEATGHGRAQLESGRGAYSLNSDVATPWPLDAIIRF